MRLALAGDVLPHDGLWQVARADARRAGKSRGSLDFGPILRPTRPVIEAADVAICHLETPVAERTGPFRSYPTFSVPPQILSAIAGTGFDACTTASNHSVDQGFEGVTRTLDALDRNGIRHTGTARTAREKRRLLRMKSGGLELALLSYTYGTNGLPVDADKPWSVNLIGPAAIRADARRAKARGADVVVVALHWGDEYSHAPSDYQLTVADEVTRSRDVDLVYGHHAHVVQPVRKVNGTWVAFGLGNFVAEQETEVVGVYEGMIAEFDLVPRRSGRVDVRWAGYRPTYIGSHNPARPRIRVHDIDAALSAGTLPLSLRERMRAARERVRSVVGEAPPARVSP